MIVAMFVVAYEYDVVDSKGKIMKRPPVPDYNDLQKVRALISPNWQTTRSIAD
jgi:sterol 14-demethylase